MGKCTARGAVAPSLFPELTGPNEPPAAPPIADDILVWRHENRPPKGADLTGWTIGRWKVLERSERTGGKGYRAWYWCRCTCGALQEVLRCNLVSDNHRACGKCGWLPTRLKIEVGRWYGSLLVVGGPATVHSPRWKKSRLLYDCRCLCGATRQLRADDLLRGKRTRCRKCRVPDQLRPWRVKLGRALARANQKGLPFDLTLEFLAELFQRQNGRCALTAMPLTTGTAGASGHDGTASLDRIDSARGYTRDNVQWVHKILNQMKVDMTVEEFVSACRLVVTKADLHP